MDFEPTYTRWLTELQTSGYRLTEPRRALVKIIASAACALSPLDLFDLGRKAYPGLGLVTVYRTLDKLEELGLIQRVHLPNGCHRYIRAFDGHEHLLLCTSCGYVVFFKGDNLDRLIETNEAQSGFVIQEHWLQLFGLCQSCRVSSEVDRGQS